MKALFFILMLAPGLATVAPDFAGITQAISKGDAEALSQYFDESVEIAVLEEEDIYNKSEAKTIVDKFFQQYKPKSFSQVHQGTSKGQDSKYCIGNLVAGDASFRVYLYMKVEGSSYLIQEIRFDKE